ncbi:hypothetical protein [Streptomyces sp. NBC_00893]|uniref:hypothetical protein n=1 Tax=Streptomyces sp. NBC_00893 TaxID=2975862 RepID=UPI002B1D772D|nr:hypothetical protein [Streptomyces sp. NBC_00893]
MGVGLLCGAADAAAERCGWNVIGPEVRHSRPGAESGFGLHLVGAPATAWGVKDRVVGKMVWA